MPSDVRTDSALDFQEVNRNVESNSVSSQDTILNKTIFGLAHDHTYSKISKKPKVLKSKAKNLKSNPEKKKNLKNTKTNTLSLNTKQSKLKILFLNIGGLRGKLRASDFFEKMEEYDISCLVEAKIDKNDLEIVKNKFEKFDIFSNINENYVVEPRAGIIVLSKKHISPHLSFFECKNEISLFFKINRNILNSNKDLLCACVYIPPSTSLYKNDNNFELLTDELIKNKQNFMCDTLIVGDFNAKTNTLPDYVAQNKYTNLTNSEDYPDFELTRYNQDRHVADDYGLKLLHFCKVQDLYIINGRVGKDKNVGNFTTKNASTIDYCLTSPHFFHEIDSFEVEDFNPILSDVHCALSLELKSLIFEGEKPETNQKKHVKKVKWDPKYAEKYQNNLNRQKIENLEKSLENIDTLGTKNEDISEIINQLNEIFTTAKEKTFNKNGKKIFAKKGWYDFQVEKAKKDFKKARSSKQKRKVQISGRRYKNLLRKKEKTHISKMTTLIRKARKKDSAYFWYLLKGPKKSETIKVSLEDFEEFFRDLNVDKTKNTQGDNFEELEHPSNDITDMLNASISDEEIQKGLKALKNKKAVGIDNILNEEIKATFSIFKNIYKKIFNLILDTGIFPEIWADGLIIPLFKKGQKNDPNNYRGITLISCLSKFFTIILNNRLKIVVEKILSEIQAGFRPGYSTLDHIFSLYCIFILYKRMNKPLYMAFIDYQKAFDTIWRAGLWYKLMKQGISGKFLNVIKNMYQKSKSRVFLHGEKSNSFPAETGVKQGDILSPLLFALYINDLEKCLKDQGVQSLQGINSVTEELELNYDLRIALDLLLLYYADDTIILADSAIGLQFALEELQTYCENWKLVVNEGKTKVMCINRREHSDNKFYYNDKELEVVSNFTYLGINFNTRGITAGTINERLISAEKAMFSTLVKCKQNKLPIDISLEMFEKTVIPCALYGAEIFGFNSVAGIETLQLKYIKYSLKLKKSTPTVLVYGETGMLPIEYYVKCRMLGFWVYLVTTKQEKISYKLFTICTFLFLRGLLICPWLQEIKNILEQCGTPFVFYQYQNLDKKWLKNIFLPKIKITLRDQVIQNWAAKLSSDDSTKFLYYKEYGNKFGLKNYFSILPQDLWIPMCKFRTNNHKLPVEIYSWNYFNKQRNERTCNLCNLQDIGDEYHYVMRCPVFDELRKLYVPKYFQNRPSVFKFIELMKTEDNHQLFKLARFFKDIMNVIQ